MNYCIDIYGDVSRIQFRNADVKEKSHPKYGTYWQVKASAREKRRLERICHRRGIRFRSYEERWERSGDYRRSFFSYERGPYRCRYCNRKLAKEKMQVDHIVPVAKAKTSVQARMWLYIRGISNVNDVRNLAPSCAKCNRRKGAKTGLWTLKGFLGKYKAYWAVLYFIRMVLVVLLIAAAYALFHMDLHFGF